MNCPFCKHKLETKQTRGGLYGKCYFCKFCGYLPVGDTLPEVSKDTPGDTPETVLKKTVPEVSKDTPEDTPEDYTCPVCGQFYKTEGGIRRHFQRVSNEEEIHPTIYKRHDKYFSERKGT